MHTNKQISETFSKGKFNETYSAFAENISWQIIGSNITEGKDNVINYCNKMQIDIGATILNNVTVIEESNNIAITGFCNFVDEKTGAGRVDYCDVYEFENNLLKKIISYCIDVKAQ